MMITRLLPALLLTVLPVAAQQMNVRTLALRGGEFPQSFLKSKSEFVPLRFSEIQPSPAVKVQQESPLQIYQLSETEDGKQEYAVAAQVAVPAGSADLLLIGIADGDEARFVAFKDNISSAGAKDWVLINGTSEPILLQVGEDNEPIGIPAGQSRLAEIEAEDGKGAAAVARAKVNDEVKVIYSTYWPVFADKRGVVLFIEDQGKIRVKRISDSLQGDGTAEGE